MEAGAVVVAVSAVIAVTTAFFLRPRLGSVPSVAILALAGAGIGYGAMLLQPDPSTGELAAAVALLAVLIPAHVRIVLGPFGPRR